MSGAMFLAAFLGCAQAAELAHPDERQASAGTIPLSLGTAPFGNYGFDAYGFNGAIPGPTLRVNPGEDLIVELTNSLSSATACSATSGPFCDSMITNLHTHGLHVSSKGVEDGLDYHSDNIMAEVAPGQTTTFKFSIPANHMGGTHWYHPHHHHATALQAGGGAAGLLIVDDPPGYLPTEYANMTEKILFISGHNLNTLQEMAVAANAQVLQTAATDAAAANLARNVFMVNGQVGPTMAMPGNAWHRLRMVYAAVEQTLTLALSGNANCEWKLLAKDGIYLESIPRDIVNVHLYPGARSDVAISCSCTNYPCEAVLAGVGGGGGGRDDGPAVAGAGAAGVDLMILSISEGAAAAPATLPLVSVQRPCYLVDLRSATVTGSRDRVSLNDRATAVQWNGNGQSMTYQNIHGNGGSMTSWPPLTTLQSGKVYEMAIDGIDEHPFHIHVNPFQIVDMGAAMYANDYFWVGDWHDTLLLGEHASSATLRYQTDAFTGKIILHCHILEHEDEGMMGVLHIEGTEGGIFSEASTLDSTCYHGLFETSACENLTCWKAGSDMSASLSGSTGGIKGTTAMLTMWSFMLASACWTI